MTAEPTKTVAKIHKELIGTKITIDGWEGIICDTTETTSGRIFVAVRVLAAPAIYLEGKWHLLKQ